MMEGMQECIGPDSLTGMILAMEGVRGAMVLLNGPMGCKFYHSTTSQFLTIRPTLYLPVQGEEARKVPVDYNYLNDWFFRQPRVPSTALDGYDYVYGTAEKVEEALIYIRDHVDFSLLAIVNSPGASLIGDNLKELADRILPERNCVMLESPGFSMDYDAGYADAVRELLKQMKEKMKNPVGRRHRKNRDDNSGKWMESSGEKARKRRPKVNLLGLSVWDRYAEGDRQEWKRMLDLCGIDVNCCLCSENTLEELLNVPAADLNLVIDPVRGMAAASWLKETYGQPCYVCPSLPVGFAATEQMAEEICRILGTSVDALIEDSHRARAVCFSKIRDIYHMCGLPSGASFAVEGSEAQKKAFGAFLTDYLGMHPAAKEEAELVFGDANTISQLKLLDQGQHVFCGIEISLPGMGYTDVIPKTQMGIHGAMFLVEQVLNGLMSKL